MTARAERLKCPACGHPHSAVKDSRLTDQGEAIWRRRQCRECGHRFSTKEQIVLYNEKGGYRVLCYFRKRGSDQVIGRIVYNPNWDNPFFLQERTKPTEFSYLYVNVEAEGLLADIIQSMGEVYAPIDWHKREVIVNNDPLFGESSP